MLLRPGQRQLQAQLGGCGEPAVGDQIGSRHSYLSVLRTSGATRVLHHGVMVGLHPSEMRTLCRWQATGAADGAECKKCELPQAQRVRSGRRGRDRSAVSSAVAQVPLPVGPYHITMRFLSNLVEPLHHHYRRPSGLDHQRRREAVQHARLGPGIFPRQRRGARHRAPRRQQEARARSLPAGHGPERPGRRAPAPASFLRHPAIQDSGARHRVRQRHQGVRLRGHLHHGLSGQGEPAAARDAGDRRVRGPYGVGLEVGSKPELRRCSA